MSPLTTTPFDDLEPSAVLKPKDIAARLDVDERSVRRAIARGELVASRTCGIRILAGDAAAWWRARLIDARRKGSPEAPPDETGGALTPEPPPALSSPVPVSRPKSIRRSPRRLPLPARGGGS